MFHYKGPQPTLIEFGNAEFPGLRGLRSGIGPDDDERRLTADRPGDLASEIRDLFFDLVNVARWKHVDAESALRGTNMKFKRRFAYVEQGAKRQERKLSELTLEEMDHLWTEVKRKES